MASLDLIAKYLCEELRLLAADLPPNVLWREEQEDRGGFAFIFNTDVHPHFEVAGGPGWFNLFYGSAGFEQSLTDTSTADWVLAVCDSVFAGHVTEKRTGFIATKWVTTFELHTRGIDQTVTETTWGFAWPHKKGATTRMPRWS